MTIIFLCASLEPGSDGVGDYTRKLAAALSGMGHKTFAVALNDRHIKATIHEQQAENTTLVEVLRIPSGIHNSERFRLAASYIRNIHPDWLSLQFVPYGFNDKGLPFGLQKQLKRLYNNASWHIMFHELWVGVDGRLTFKNRIVQWLQKFIITRLLKKLQPILITTSIPVYRVKLEKYRARQLPLFSNIGVVSFPKKEVLPGSFKVLHFGSFTGYGEELDNQFEWLGQLAKKHHKTVDFIVAGSAGPFKNMALALARQAFGEGNVHDKGKLPAEDISALMQDADMGISRAGHLMFGKSGTTMAMLEHGLPVLLRGSRVQTMSETGEFPGRLFFPGDAVDEIPAKQDPHPNRVKEIARLFVKYLNN